jgi:hypothetical protein
MVILTPHVETIAGKLEDKMSDIDFGYDDDNDDYKTIEEREQEEAEECHCGAWQWNESRGKYIHVADCCC